MNIFSKSHPRQKKIIFYFFYFFRSRLICFSFAAGSIHCNAPLLLEDDVTNGVHASSQSTSRGKAARA